MAQNTFPILPHHSLPPRNTRTQLNTQPLYQNHPPHPIHKLSGYLCPATSPHPKSP
nr:hypothetical protein [uncultured Kingella sp.]